MDDESTRELPAVGEETDTYPTLASGVALADGPLAPPPLDDADDEWPVRGPSGGVRLAYPIAALAGVVLVAGGFWGGAALEKGHAASSSSGRGAAASGLAARLRAALGVTGATGATGASGAAGFGGFGGTSAAAVGTVSVVAGDTLYVLTSSGALVKVDLGGTTSVTRNAKGTPASLRPGDTVVVQGSTAANGDVSATSVAATAPGVTAGGFGGGGRFSGGGFGGSGGATTTTSG